MAIQEEESPHPAVKTVSNHIQERKGSDRRNQLMVPSFWNSIISSRKKSDLAKELLHQLASVEPAQVLC